METFGLTANGVIILERVKIKTSWTMRDCGRFIYELSTDTIWIGGTSIDDGDNGWFQIGLTKSSINTYHIDWDTELSFLSNKISAINVPCLYNEIKTNVQETLYSIFEEIKNFNSGESIADEAIKPRHINFRTDDGLNASLIPITNSNSYFKVTNVDLALDYCYELSKDPLLPDNTEFGTLIGIKVGNVNEALIELEKYLKTFKSVDISATYLLSPESTNVQFVLDALYKYISEVELLVKMTHNITDLQGVPNNFGNNLQFLQSNGVNGYCLIDLTSELIPTRYCLETVTIQNAFDTICADITTIFNSSDSILNEIATLKIQINEILCQIENILEQLTLISIQICELWDAIQEILNKITEIWVQIDLLWEQICLIWEEIQKLWDAILVIQNTLKKKRIYFTVMKCGTNWEYGSLQSADDMNNYPPMWLYCDFTSWYNDYKNNYSPNVGNNFIVIPIVQFQSLLIPNAFQCYGYISNQSTTDPTNPRNPVWATWPPCSNDYPQSEFVEGGTLGEYPFVLYRGALGGKYSDGILDDIHPSAKPYTTCNWKFYVDIGTVAFDNNRDVRLYSGGGRIDYVIYFFGFGSDPDAILDIDSVFDMVTYNPAWKEFPLSTIMQSGILAS